MNGYFLRLFHFADSLGCFFSKLFKAFISARSDFIEGLFITGVVGIHDAVPEAEIQAIIAPYILVVQIMVCRSIEPFEERVPERSLREYLITKMPHHIKRYLPHRQNKK